MEFNKKLQALRKQSGLTQEALAEKLYVSRTAISKWESGRGYPSIDSLKDIARLFSVTVDELISGGEMLQLAEEEKKEKSARRRDFVFALLDVCASLLLVLPLFASRAGDGVESVSLYALSSVKVYLGIFYYIAVIGTVICGIVTFALQNCQKTPWLRMKSILSLSFSVISVLLFVISLQPYASLFAFVLLAVKSVLLIKRE